MNSRDWQERKNKTVFEKCAADCLVNMYDNLFFSSAGQKKPGMTVSRQTNAGLNCPVLQQMNIVLLALADHLIRPYGSLNFTDVCFVQQ